MAEIKVLIVEDESVIAMELEDRLISMGYAISGVAPNGEIAMQKIEAEYPTLILMDINLRGAQDGISVAEAVRARFEIPVIYLTAFADAETLQRAKLTTPSGYLLKPFREEELRAAIEMAVHKRCVDADMRAQAVTDSLTGLYNRRFLDETLTREFYRALREKTPLSVVMLDIDRLKQINDTYGHDAGDRAIKKIAEIIQLSLRRSDLSCRYGGDEIAIILPNTHLTDAKYKVGAIVRWVQVASISAADVEIPLSVSAGIAAAPDHADTPEALLRAADKALYFSKQSGRNQAHGVDEIP